MDSEEKNRATKPTPLALPLRLLSADSSTRHGSAGVGTSRLSSASARRIAEGGMSVRVYESFMLSPYDEQLTRKIGREIEKASKREGIILPPCRPSRVVRSAHSLVSRSSPTRRPASSTSDGAFRPPKLTQSTFAPPKAYSTADAFGIGTTGAPLISSAVSATALTFDANPQQAVPPFLLALIQRTMQLATQQEAATNLSASSNAVDIALGFEKIVISRKDHEAYVRSELVDMAQHFLTTVLPEAHARLEIEKVSSHVPQPPHIVKRPFGRSKTIQRQSTSVEEAEPLPEPSQTTPDASAAFFAQDSTSSGAMASQAVGVPLALDAAPLVEDIGLQITEPSPLRKSAHDQADSNASETMPSASSSSLPALQAEIRRLRGEIAVARRQVASAKNSPPSAPSGSPPASEAEGEAVFSRPAHDEARAEDEGVSPLLPHSDGDPYEDGMSDASGQNAPHLAHMFGAAAVVASTVRRRPSFQAATATLDKVLRVVRFRQQATFMLRRKLRALLEKRRPASRLLNALRVEGDRELLSINAGPVRVSAPSAEHSRSESPGMTQIPHAPLVSAAPPHSVSPQPWGNDTEALNRVVSPNAVMDESPKQALNAVKQLQPVLESFQSFELPVFLVDQLERTQALFAEYQELVASVRKTQQQILSLSKGTIDEKRRTLTDLGVRLNDDDDRSQPLNNRRASNGLLGGRRQSLGRRQLSRGKSKRSLSPGRKKDDPNAGQQGDVINTAFSDTGIQNTLDEELLVYTYNRLDAFVAHERAYRLMWETMYVALRNIVRLWEDIEVDLSCHRCEAMLSDAMIIAPCGTTVCRDCVRDDDENTFFTRKQEECECQSHDGAIPNVLLRRFCKAYTVRDVTGAITPVPSEALLGELDYQMKVIAESLSLLKSQSSSAEGSPSAQQKSASKESSRKTSATSTTAQTAAGGILVSSLLAAPGEKQRGGKRSGKGPNRRKSVVFQTDEGDESDADRVGSPKKGADPSSPPKPAAQPQPPSEETPIGKAIRELGLQENGAQLQSQQVFQFKKRISNAFTTQYRR